MKQLNSTLITLSLLITVVLTSCSDDDEGFRIAGGSSSDNNLNHPEASKFTNRNYTRNKLTIKSASYFLDVLKTSPCFADDQLFFLPSGALITDAGDVKCNLWDPQSDTSSWRLNDVGTEIQLYNKEFPNINPETYTILTNNGLTLRLERYDTLYFDSQVSEQARIFLELVQK